jgi:hypothetical protein
MLSAREPVPATKLRELLGGGYATAWFLDHRIREALVPPADSERSTRAKHPRYAQAYWAEARWRDADGSREERFRTAALALLEADPLALPRAQHALRRSILPVRGRRLVVAAATAACRWRLGPDERGNVGYTVVVS